MDCIRLENIIVLTKIGIGEAERSAVQTLLVTVELLHPIHAVASNDDISDGIDYAKVTDHIVKLGLTERKTIERYAEDIATFLLQQYKPEGGVTVTVRKTPPLPLSSASVTITRP
jgi:FolB domain-containing protein